MSLARSGRLALAAILVSTVASAQKNPMVGGKEMFPNKRLPRARAQASQGTARWRALAQSAGV